MIHFSQVEIGDKAWIDSLLFAADFRGCHQNFTNLFAWMPMYEYRVARVEDFLVVKGDSTGDSPYYFYPAGRGDTKTVIGALIEDAKENGYKFKFAGLPPENIDELNRLFPHTFAYEAVRDAYDYLYYLDKMVKLTGKKLSSKRNHINRFKENNSWTFEQISSKNLSECWEMNVEWCIEYGCKEDVELTQEKCAVRRCFMYFDALGLEGGLLRKEGRVIAYTMGDKLNSDTYDIHIEKAFADIQGAYQMINREFAALIQKMHPEIVYVNREEDTGSEGLRKAKLSYYPDEMEEKYLAAFL